MATVGSLHGTTAAENFASGFGRLDEIEAVSVLWRDGTVTAGSSRIEFAKLALMVLALDTYQRRAFEETTCAAVRAGTAAGDRVR